jgi:hypothetical protein
LTNAPLHTVLKDIQITILSEDNLTALDRSTQSESGKTIGVLQIVQDKLENIAKLVEATLPYVNSYVLYYRQQGQELFDDEDIEREADAIEDVPRIVQSYLHIDVPYEFQRGGRRALARAWQQLHANDRLLVITESPERAIHALKTISQAVSHGKDEPISRSAESDEDPAQGTNVGAGVG